MLFELVTTLLLATHLLLVNIASAGPLFCIYLERKAGHCNDALATRIGRRLAVTSITTLLAGATIGLLLGGLAWTSTDRSFIEILPRFTWKLWWGVAETFFTLACMAVYVAMWDHVIMTRRQVILHRLLAVLASTNLLYHFPSLFGAMAYVARHRERFGDAISTDEFRRLAYSSDVFPMTVHFCLASAAVTGVYVMWRTQSIQNVSGLQSSEVESSHKRLIEICRWSARIAFAATACQVLVGTWLLLETDPLQHQRLLGGDLFATAAFGISVLLTFVLCHYLATVALGEFAPRDVRQTALILIVLVVLMTAALRESRRDELSLPQTAAIGRFPLAQDNEALFFAVRPGVFNHFLAIGVGHADDTVMTAEHHSVT